MTTEDAPRARVTIAISSASGLSERLTGILDKANIDVDRASLRDDVRNMATQGGGSVLLIDRAQLPEDPTQFIEEILCEDDAPALVVIGDADDPLERARMLVAGATQVVDTETPDSILKATLETIAEREAAGGSDGPEIRGNAAQPELSDFLSRSKSMQRFVAMVEKVADVDCSLLITGETGVGKERLARAIHSASPRTGPFVGINCGALPEALLESQLFGHEPGAFTGAKGRHKGFFEQAAGGTMFLDEVGEIPLHLQVKLLTVLQRHEVQPLGSETAKTVDVRVMAATNRSPKNQVKEGLLREDLYYRLNVVHLQIPPLRNRVEDIPDLVGGLVQFFRCDLLRSNVEDISEPALEALMRYGWPGNVRELVNVVERAMILSNGPKLDLEDLPHEIRTGTEASSNRDDALVAPGASPSELPPEWESMSLKDVRDAAAGRAERAYLDRALRKHAGRLSRVAKQAQIGNRSIYDKMQRHGLKKEDYRK